MSKRSGPFWDGVEGRAPLPRAAATPGLEVLHIDPDQGTIELAFAGKEDFTNPAGNVLDAQGTLIATATATARVIALDQARSAA